MMDGLLGGMSYAPINPDVLRWARVRLGRSYVELETPVTASAKQIEDWEKGISSPPFGKAQKLANALHIPFGFLFLSKPPVDDPNRIPDLRTVTEERLRIPSPGFFELLTEIQLKQDWARETAESLEQDAIPFIGKFQMRDGIKAVSVDISNALGVNEELRNRSRSWSGYLAALCRNAEGLGFLVFRSGLVHGGNTKRPLSVDEFRGFALVDELAPAVFINSKDAVAAQTFTLVHELAHLWIGVSGISNLAELEGDQATYNAIELFCHGVAAETLVPESRILEFWGSRGNAESKLQAAATKFRVSTIVILRRVFDLRLISRDTFFELLATLRKKSKARKSSGGNPYNTMVARNGAKLTDAVLIALRERRLIHRDAARLLEVGYQSLNTLAERRLPQ